MCLVKSTNTLQEVLKMNHFRYKLNNEDLGHTIVENIFINHYMPSAPGDYVKVYLLGLKCATTMPDSSLSNEIMAKTLNMTPEEVKAAWEYWEEQDIIKLYTEYTDGTNSSFVIEFLSIKERMLKIKDSPKEVGKYSPERIISARKSQKVRDMFDYIRRLMGRELSQNELFTFLDWKDDYHLPPDVITLLIDDCLSRNKKDLPYLKQVAKNWFDAGIDSIEKAHGYLQRHKEKWQKYGVVLNFLRLGRQPTAVEEELMNKWFYTFGMPEEIVLKACESTAKTMKPSFSYIDKILTEWHGKNLKTLQDVEAYETKTVPQKTEEKPAKSKKSNFNNFANRTYDTKALEDMLLRKSRSELNE